jgi:hypothetical protein
MADIQMISTENPEGCLIGAASTSLVGFYGVTTPVKQCAVIADATSTTTVIAQFNTLNAYLKTLGLVATA